MPNILSLVWEGFPSTWAFNKGVTKMRSTILIAAALLAFQLAYAGASIDRDPAVTVGAGDAKLVRNSNGLSVSGRSTGLNGGNVYSVWWIVTDSSGIVVINAAGGIASNAGELGFGGTIRVGSYAVGTSVPQFVLVGGSLVDPLNATVVLHVVDHGPPIPGLIPTQMKEISAAGCPVGCFLGTEYVFSP